MNSWVNVKGMEEWLKRSGSAMTTLAVPPGEVIHNGRDIAPITTNEYCGSTQSGVRT